MESSLPKTNKFQVKDEDIARNFVTQRTEARVKELEAKEGVNSVKCEPLEEQSLHGYTIFYKKPNAKGVEECLRDLIIYTRKDMNFPVYESLDEIPGAIALSGENLAAQVGKELRKRVQDLPWVYAAFVSPDGTQVRIHGSTEDFEHGEDAHKIGSELEALFPLDEAVPLAYRRNGTNAALNMNCVYVKEGE